MIKELLRIKKTNFSLPFFVVVYMGISIWAMASTPLFDEDEGFFAEAARHILATGDMITITVNGEERFDKPALFLWVTALSLRIFGQNELAVRLPSFLCFVTNVFLIYKFVLKNFGAEKAHNAVLAACSMLQFLVLGRASMADNLLNLCVSYAIIQAYHFSLNQHKRNLFLFYTAAGLGFFTKGPIAFLVLFTVVGSYLILAKKKDLIIKYINFWMILWCLFIPLPWFYLAYLQSGDYLFMDFFIKHNLGRYTQTMERHGGYLWYYVPVLLISLIPFSHLLVNTVRNFQKSNLNIILILWFSIPFLFFSFSKTQLPHYISVSIIPLIILLIQVPKLGEKAIFIQTLALLLILTIIPKAAGFIPISDFFLAELISGGPSIFDYTYQIFMIFLMVLSIAIFIWSSKKTIGFCLIVIIASTLFINKFGRLQQGPVKEFGLLLRNNANDIFMTDHYNPSLSFYAQKSFSINNNLQAGQLYFSKVTSKIPLDRKVKVKHNGYFVGQKQ